MQRLEPRFCSVWRCLVICVLSVVHTDCVRCADRPGEPQAETKSQTQSEELVDFAREVRPILARNCFPCHGPDDQTREADLRLDIRDAAIQAAIKPGHPDHSLLIERVMSSDEDEVMPPPGSSKSLNDHETSLLARWIKQGATYQQHWSFVPPTKSTPPEKSSSWERTIIDRFLRSRMDSAGIQPATEADSITLVRRLYLDLLGLPPTPEQADEFVANDSPDAYANLVTKLLQSKHYGERWARPWLDLARYSDTNGYEKDRPRSIWPYRDWVIQSLNADMPFDQFSIEQLAGDMLPNSTADQRIATGFHRNTMLNEEGGIDPLEYRFYAMVDRVATTGTVWMGLTVGCAQCHSHKYDPISHSDYYRFFALLNNADEPDLLLPAEDDSNREDLVRQIEALESKLVDQFPVPDRVEAEGEAKDPAKEDKEHHFQEALNNWCETQRRHSARWTVTTPEQLHSNLPKLERLNDNSIFASGDFTKRDEYVIQLNTNQLEPITAIRLEVLPDDRLPARGPGRAYYEGRKGDFFLSEIQIKVDDELLQYKDSSRSYGKIAIGSGSAEASNVYDDEGSTGWSTANREGERHTLVLNLKDPIQTNQLNVTMLFERHFVAALGRFRFSVTSDQGDIRAQGLSAEVEQSLQLDRSEWTEQQAMLVQRAFLNASPKLAAARKKIDAIREKLRTPHHTLVLQEREPDNPRTTFRHHRGEWLSPREEVKPGVPSIFQQLDSTAPADRLNLARWLTSRNNPLVARVVVNRAWRQLMGYGLVRSDGDFGTQSDPPTHPQLLDWLACELMEQGWSMKWLHREIVMSAAYRQNSNATAETLAADPSNTLFARGTRHRLDAETIRDVMLSASGLLTAKIGGPSVYPPQPRSVTSIAYGNTAWPISKGKDRYRRSLYTYSKRTAPFAAFTTFDATSGENCVAKRTRSNTPLQSLTLLNDEMYLEFARALAKRAADQDGDASQQLSWMFRRLLTRQPRQAELDRLIEFYSLQKKRIEDGELSAAELSGEEETLSSTGALILVARAIMNLDETITKH